MSIQEFQKYHDEMKALRVAGNVAEFTKRFAAKGSIFMSPVHAPTSADQTFKLSSDQLSKMPVEAKIDELVQLGDIVVDRSSIVVKLPTGERKGWNLSVWVKEDGHWKIRNSCTTFLHDK